MTIYYLYVKTHLKTGLKYLGYTKNDPFKYKGSGKYWLRHIKIYGKDDIWTNIIFQTKSKEEIKSVGLYFSDFWNVVESTNWANLRPESGDGGCGFEISSEQNSIFRKEWWNIPENKTMMKQIHNNSKTKLRKSLSIKSLWADQEYKVFHTEKIKESANKPENKKANSKRQKDLWKDKDFRNQRTFYCNCCDRTIVTKANWSKHLKSKKHIEKIMS